MNLDFRVRATLDMMARWGYAPSVEALAENLLGGSVALEELVELLRNDDGLLLDQEFVSLEGREDLIRASRQRVERDHVLNGQARTTAAEFTSDLLRVCPFVSCVSLTGSAASGGYEGSDDIDLDLFVRPGTKYVCYLLATILGLKFSWRFRDRPISPIHRTPIFRKVICLNVVWTENQTRPFVRQDVDLAFELMRSRPIFGVSFFQRVCNDNSWLRNYFPQLFERVLVDQVRVTPSKLRAFLVRLTLRPRMLRVLEVISRGVSWTVYHFVQGSRRRNPSAMARATFLRRVKYPYEVFQD